MKSPRDDPTLSKASTKAKTGIAGLIKSHEAGLPHSRMTLLTDGPGCGKTLIDLRANRE
jgi:KaiC/GvpD/RAD55 family RecA-like ATPase